MTTTTSDGMVTAMESSSSPSLPVALPRTDIRLRSERAPRRFLVHEQALANLRTSTCPQCGVAPASVAIDEELSRVPPWVYVLFLFNVLFVLIAVVATRRTIRVRYRLCVECAASRRQARTTRFLGLVGIVMLPVLFAMIALGAGASAGTVGLASLTGAVAGVVGKFAAHRQTRRDLIRLAALDKKRGVAELEAPDSFYKVLEDEAPAALASS